MEHPRARNHLLKKVARQVISCAAAKIVRVHTRPTCVFSVAGSSSEITLNMLPHSRR